MTELEQIQKSIDGVNKKLDTALQKISKVESYLYNDDATDSLGLVNQVRKNTGDISEIKEENRVRKRVLAVIGIIAGFIGMILGKALGWIVAIWQAKN